MKAIYQNGKEKEVVEIVDIHTKIIEPDTIYKVLFKKEHLIIPIFSKYLRKQTFVEWLYENL